MSGIGGASGRLGTAGPLFAGAHQPARRDFGITQVMAGDLRLPVQTRDALKTPFFKLVEFSTGEVPPQGDLLIVTPLSGHFAILARDLIVGLLPYFRVYVTDWVNVRHVPARYGAFGLEKNISSVVAAIKALSPGAAVLGLCQGGVPALAATAVLSQRGETNVPARLILIASPIDPLANPTRVVTLVRSRPLSWYENTLIAPVPECFTGHGRRVYSANLHLLTLSAYLTRHVSQGTDTGAKLLFDDGAEPARFPFFDLYTSLMDLDAQFFLENTRSVFQDCLLPNGALHFEGEPIVPGAIHTTSLLTIEGGRDDIAAPGQTSAAHGLCTAIPTYLRRRLIVPHSGHFSLFYGETWRNTVLPAIRDFRGFRRRGRSAASTSLARI